LGISVRDLKMDWVYNKFQYLKFENVLGFMHCNESLPYFAYRILQVTDFRYFSENVSGVKITIMKYILSLILFFAFTTLNAQTETIEERPYVKKSFVIILSSKSFAEAKRIAFEAAEKLNLKLDLRKLKPDKESGLTFSRKECESNGWDYPCYVSRGRYDDGEFITIDYSDAFTGFAKGYYIVTTAGGDAVFIKSVLNKVKKVYKTASIKQTEIFIGCMH
jgi:hypothetical protein